MTVAESVLTDHLCLELCIDCTVNDAPAENNLVIKIIWDADRAGEFREALDRNIEYLGLRDLFFVQNQI